MASLAVVDGVRSLTDLNVALGHDGLAQRSKAPTAVQGVELLSHTGSVALSRQLRPRRRHTNSSIAATCATLRGSPAWSMAATRVVACISPN